MKGTVFRIGMICAVLAVAVGGFVYANKHKKGVVEDNVQKDETILTVPVDASEENEYFLKIEDGFVVVYEEDERTVYEKTGITADSLPEELQEELKNGKKVKNNRELYSFLESFSS